MLPNRPQRHRPQRTDNLVSISAFPLPLYAAVATLPAAPVGPGSTPQQNKPQSPRTISRAVTGRSGADRGQAGPTSSGLRTVGLRALAARQPDAQRGGRVARREPGRRDQRTGARGQPRASRRRERRAAATWLKPDRIAGEARTTLQWIRRCQRVDTDGALKMRPGGQPGARRVIATAGVSSHSLKPFSFPGENRADRTDFRARGPVRQYSRTVSSDRDTLRFRNLQPANWRGTCDRALRGVRRVKDPAWRRCVPSRLSRQRPGAVPACVA